MSKIPKGTLIQELTEEIADLRIRVILAEERAICPSCGAFRLRMLDNLHQLTERVRNHIGDSVQVCDSRPRAKRVPATSAGGTPIAP